MTKIDELLSKVDELESSVNTDWNKEDLYDVLVVAYSHLKDIIVLQQDLVPIVEDKASEAALNDQLATYIAENGRLKDRIAVQDDELFKLNAWKDGANLEGEQMRDEIKDLSSKVTKLLAAFNDIEQILANTK